MPKSNNNYCTIYIARHGESEWNVKKKIQGQQQHVPLTANGEKQAQDLANKLKHVKFDAIFSSDLLRAQRTAEVIAIDKKLAVKTSQALRERKFGQVEGKTGQEFEQEFKELLNKRDQLSEPDKLSFKLADDIESDEELIARLITFLREIAVAYSNQSVLMITHSGPIRTLLIHLGFATREQLHHRSIDNTAYVKLQSDGVDFFIKETFGVNKRNIHQ